MNLALKNSLKPKNELMWSFLRKSFEVGENDQSFLTRLLKDSNISLQLDEVLVQNILDSLELETLLEEIFPLQVYRQTVASPDEKHDQRMRKYVGYVADYCQRHCRKDIINVEPGVFFSRLRQQTNNRLGKLSFTDDLYLTEGLKRLAGYKGVTLDCYEGAVSNNLFDGGNKKGCGVAIKLILIFGKKPNESLTEKELSRFERYKRFGEKCFENESVSSKATDKALSITAWKLLDLRHNDLIRLWNEVADQKEKLSKKFENIDRRNSSNEKK